MRHACSCRTLGHFGVTRFGLSGSCTRKQKRRGGASSLEVDGQCPSTPLGALRVPRQDSRIPIKTLSFDLVTPSERSVPWLLQTSGLGRGAVDAEPAAIAPRVPRCDPGIPRVKNSAYRGVDEGTKDLAVWPRESQHMRLHELGNLGMDR